MGATSETVYLAGIYTEKGKQHSVVASFRNA